jgi:putative FmdB family regulatory protein
MPTYEYACSSCGNTWEEMQKITEPALEVCPACKKATAKRQISGGNFILKGGGWYADLYSSSKPKGASDSGGSKSESAPTEAKAEPKADAKKDGGSGGSSGGAGSSGTGGSGTSSGGGSSASTAAAG